ncbi:YbaB/EbfC family nucleoid-associated protein [Mailhella massiliensis]|uniref:Nucleoid-associated protein K8W16_05920 n=1 Tax=Mailhella massiliensis TaxID=1903261 RepID=A0A921AW12_9BACT|nr:YbaB/EbfC family nucleoid-associated protein [Mailhella massiliensis]HJD97163.1 YbaB/EbfC family nucleoid-associated protein [Mailhella massiliensis]
MKNMNDLLRQAQVMQNKIAKLQQEMAEKDVEASAGGGMVKVVMNGRQEMKSITIDKAILESGDTEMLQDLVITAVNEAVRIGRANLEREMANISGGIHLPGMF